MAALDRQPARAAARPALGPRRADARRRGRSATARPTAALGEIGDLDDLLDQLGQEHPGATLDDVDVEAVERRSAAQAADDVRRLQELERELRRQGWVHRAATTG